MSNEGYQFGKDDGVDKAVNVASDFVTAMKGSNNAGSVEEAVRVVAHKSGIGQAFVLRLIQPSRRPKSVDVGIWSRLVHAYLKYLRLQHRELEIKIKLVESLARSDQAAVRDLLDEATALQDRIKALL